MTVTGEGAVGRLPPAVVRLLAGAPLVGAVEQAFPLLTVDDAGFPHLYVLSRADVDVADDGGEGRLAIAGRRTRAHLRRDGRATLLAVDGDTVHVAKLVARREVAADGVAAVAFSVASVDRSTAGVPLTPLSFTLPAELPRHEAWDRRAHLLRTLAAG